MLRHLPPGPDIRDSPSIDSPSTFAIAKCNRNLVFCSATCLATQARAELARGNPEQAVALLTRAVSAARRASLLPWRVQDAEDTLREAKAAVR